MPRGRKCRNVASGKGLVKTHGRDAGVGARMNCTTAGKDFPVHGNSSEPGPTRPRRLGIFAVNWLMGSWVIAHGAGLFSPGSLTIPAFPLCFRSPGGIVKNREGCRNPHGIQGGPATQAVPPKQLPR